MQGKPWGNAETGDLFFGEEKTDLCSTDLKQKKPRLLPARMGHPLPPRSHHTCPRYSRRGRSRGSWLPTADSPCHASPLLLPPQAQLDTWRGLPRLPPFPPPRRACDDSGNDFIFFAADLLGSLFFPLQAGGLACWPPSAMPHSIVLYKQRILAKIQKTLPRKKGRL